MTRAQTHANCKSTSATQNFEFFIRTVISQQSRERNTPSYRMVVSFRFRGFAGLDGPNSSEFVTSLGFHSQFKYDDRVKNIGTQYGDHEAAVIRAFVQGDKQERFLGFLANPKNRKKFTESLSHFRWFDPRFVAPISWKVDPKLTLWEKHVSGIENIYRLLKSKGAGLTCLAISEDSEIDGRELDW